MAQRPESEANGGDRRVGGAMAEVMVFTAFLLLLSLAFWLLLRALHATETKVWTEERLARLRRRQFRQALKWLRRREQRLKEDILRRLEEGRTEREGRHQN